jgi:hypothetical protein
MDVDKLPPGEEILPKTFESDSKKPEPMYRPWNYCRVRGCSCQGTTARVFDAAFIRKNIELAVAILNHEFRKS